MDDDDRKYGNIETGLPGSQQSLNDINDAFEEMIDSSDDDEKGDR